jgi:predicted nucleotidyltransferase component of viral defense system
MKEHLRKLAASADNDLARWSLAREYLQARVLESLQDKGVFLRWAFVGGTALRFLFGLPRFSEDLDFSLITQGEDAG